MSYWIMANFIKLHEILGLFNPSPTFSSNAKSFWKALLKENDSKYQKYEYDFWKMIYSFERTVFKNPIPGHSSTLYLSLNGKCDYFSIK